MEKYASQKYLQSSIFLLEGCYKSKNRTPIDTYIKIDFLLLPEKCIHQVPHPQKIDENSKLPPKVWLFLNFWKHPGIIQWSQNELKFPFPRPVECVMSNITCQRKRQTVNFLPFDWNRTCMLNIIVLLQQVCRDNYFLKYFLFENTLK